MEVGHSERDDRPYATAGGFFVGDRVEVCGFRDEQHRGRPKGRVIGRAGREDEMVRVEVDDGLRMALWPRYLTRIED